MRLAVYSTVSTLLSTLVILSAWTQRKNFFTTCIHLTNKSSNLLLLMNMMMVSFIWAGKFLQRLFFGPLRALEVEHLYERAWFAVTETFLAMTIFRDEFDVQFAFLFGTLLFIKVFHWITSDRVDFMEQTPNIDWKFHLKINIIMISLALSDLAHFAYAIHVTYNVEPGMMIIFGFEYMILLCTIIGIYSKYCLHTIDLRRENPWEEKSIFIFYVDLVVDFLKLLTYTAFFSTIVYFYGLPLHIIRDLYMTLRSFVKRCNDLVQYRKATANMNERYPNATDEDLSATDRICIVCREEMEVVAPTPGVIQSHAAKKLPCGHIFHFRCLRSWLERQQACPTCRRSVLDSPDPTSIPEQQPQQPVGAAGAPVPQPPVPQQPGAQQTLLPIAASQQLQTPNQLPNVGPINQGFRSVGQNNLRQSQSLNHISSPIMSRSASNDMIREVGFVHDSQILSQAIPLHPVTLTPLMPLTNQIPILDHLSDDQIRSMEGSSRQAIAHRLETLQNIQLQLTGIITQLTQLYVMIPDEHFAANPSISSLLSTNGAVSLHDGSTLNTSISGNNSNVIQSQSGVGSTNTHQEKQQQQPVASSSTSS